MMISYTKKEEQFIRDNWEGMSIPEMASAMGRTTKAIRNKRWRMRLVSREKFWTSEEIEALRKLYSKEDGVLDLKSFAESTGHPAGNISRKAKELGLDTRKKRPRKKKPPGELCEAYRMKIDHERRTPEEQKEYISQVRREQIRKNGHSRGKRVIRTCPNCGKFFDIENSSPTTHCSYECSLVRPRSIKSYTRGKGGKRPDLNNQYFRSRWEANYARYLNFLIKNNGDVAKWEYEADTFWFKNIQRGVRAYTPDFKIWDTNGNIEYHEVKGWDYPRGKTARKRMAKYYPLIKLILIDEDFFKALKRQGIDALIDGWESKSQE